VEETAWTCDVHPQEAFRIVVENNIEFADGQLKRI